MARKYTVSFKEVNYGSVIVSARDAGEAKVLAEQEYARGNVIWKDTELKLRSVEKEATRGEER